MMLFSRSAILPATPVHPSGIRTLKSPCSTSDSTLNSTAPSSSSIIAVIEGNLLGRDACLPKSRFRPRDRAARERVRDASVRAESVLDPDLRAQQDLGAVQRAL